MPENLSRRKFLISAAAAASLVKGPSAAKAENLTLKNEHLREKYKAIQALYRLSTELEKAKNAESILRIGTDIVSALRLNGKLFVYKVNEQEWIVESPAMVKSEFIFEFGGIRNKELEAGLDKIINHFTNLNEFTNIDIIMLIINQLFNKINDIPTELKGSTIFSELRELFGSLYNFLENTYSKWNVPTAKALGLRVVREAAKFDIDLPPTTGRAFRERLGNLPPSDNLTVESK